MADLSFTGDELNRLHQALLTCSLLARDEERTLQGELAKHRPVHGLGISGCDDCKIADAHRADAALRAYAYELLASRVSEARRAEIPEPDWPGRDG